ncbi:MAG: prolipoprotein diacylglyceryl transferase [Candidatus Woesearchaeota archaeon]
MFIHNINPILIPLNFIADGFGIRYYGIIYALGFLISYFFLKKQKNFLKLNDNQIDNLFLYIILGTIIGARFLDFIFFNPLTLIQNPLELFFIWKGGLSFHGGLIGCITAIYLYSKKHKIKIYKITDTLVIPASLMLFFGRIANFINAELIGTITNLPWAVNFNNELGSNGQLIGRHPSQLYEAVKNLAIFFTLYLIKNHEEKTKTYKEGFRTWIFILLYGLLRLITNIWRDDYKWFFNIMGSGQILSLIMFIIATYILIKKYKIFQKDKLINK